MGCGDKIKHTCGKKVKAICTQYDGNIPDFSELKDEDCVTIEETTEDIYEILEDIKDNQLDLSDLGQSCIEYEELDGEITIPNALIALEESICEIKEEIGLSDDNGSNSSSNLDLTGLNLDYKCLSDPCNNPIKDLKTLLQALIDKVCDCCPDTVERKSTEFKGAL